jgi:hypothetical protein
MYVDLVLTVHRALGPADSKLNDPDTKQIPGEKEEQHKGNKVDRLISKFFHLGHHEPDPRTTTDVETSEKVLEEALANNNQPAIPADASRDHEISSLSFSPHISSSLLYFS